MKKADINGLMQILDNLREKCPWDRKQTIHTLRQQTIEELYELTDTITKEDWPAMKEELGDMLLHILFYAKIASERNQFTLQDVIEGISRKLIARHPHIYGNVEANTEEEVKKNWEKLKLKEGKSSVMSGVPSGMPSLIKAQRIQEKARQSGFEWPNKEQVWEKVEEEQAELLEALGEGNIAEMENESGDLLFSIINYIRFLKVDADKALELTNQKFINRFQKMEIQAQSEGKQLQDMTLAEMDEIWNTVKKQTN